MTDDTGGQIVERLQTILPWLGLLVVSITILAFVIGLILRLYNYYRKYNQEAVLLELTPPAFTNKAPLATTQLFSVLHGLLKSRSFKDALLRYVPSFSLEIVSTKDKGIRYLIRSSKINEELIRQAVAAYSPDVKVRVVKDVHVTKGFMTLQTYKQTEHYAMPLDTSKSLHEHDPVAYLTNSMTKLEDSERVSLQLVVTPAVISEAFAIDRKIRQGYWSGSSLEKKFGHRSIFRIIFAIVKLPFVIVWSMIFAFLYHDLPASSKATNNLPANTHIPPAEQELLDRMHEKLTQDLFYVDIRTQIVATDKARAKSRAQSLANSMATYATPTWQRLRTTVVWIPWFGVRHRIWVLDHRLPSLIHRSSNVLSSTELSALYHFPHSSSARTENVSKSLSKTLPAPTSLKSAKYLDVVLGKNSHLGSETLIGLTEAERERHVYIIGGTGNGKTTMLQYGIVQDIKDGKGLAVIDPHGDMALTLLKYIPKERIKDVIYFNPDDIDHPLAMNLLEIPDGLTGSALEREKDRVTESVISVLRKIFSDDDSGGHRIEYVLRNAIQTALTTEDPTIFTTFELLTNDNYRKKITNALPAGTLKNFWQNELGKAGAMQRVKMSHGVTSKIGRFEFSPSTKRVMGRAKSTIDFDDILASGKILICNFSKGNLGEDTSELFGTAVLAKLQLAALRRSRLTQDEREPFYLYVDEFQNFATMPFVQMLSEARKYKLFLTMAEQSTAQQDEQRLVQIILANVGTVISFRTGSPVDEQLVLPLFRPFIDEGEIANLPSYSFYARLSAIKSQEPMSGETILLEDEGDKAIARKVIESSRQLYAYEFQDQTIEKKSTKAVAKAHETKDVTTIDPQEDEPLEV
ncbi:ATP-binding protein [Candidatus Saccharibacteria bacterium]|nr:ATP-binding protein [Candidatus Saccharibacteria bacterium]